MKDRQRFWHLWLVAVTVVIMVFGLSMMLAPGPTRQIFGLLLFSSPDSLDVFGDRASTYVTLVHGVLGATMFGWSIALLGLILGVMRKRSFEAWLVLTISLLAWFLADTAFSLWLGFWQNAALNSVLMLLFAIPLSAVFRAHREAGTWTSSTDTPRRQD